jgi:ABC-2 type transport system ATP-binding protein
MVRLTSGAARVFGLDAAGSQTSVQIRRRTGFVSEEKVLYGYMTVEEMIRFTSSFFPQWRGDLVKRYLRDFDLPPDRKVKALSRGMRTKLTLLLALCRGAELLIVDEPTSGLDPAMIEGALQAMVAHVADENMTVFFSSHHIAEVEQIADRVAIIDRGRLVVSGALDDVRDSFRRIQLVFESDAPRVEFRAPGVARVQHKGRVMTRRRAARGRGGPCTETADARDSARDSEGHFSRGCGRGGLKCSGTNRGSKRVGDF